LGVYSGKRVKTKEELRVHGNVFQNHLPLFSRAKEYQRESNGWGVRYGKGGVVRSEQLSSLKRGVFSTFTELEKSVRKGSDGGKSGTACRDANRFHL